MFKVRAMNRNVLVEGFLSVNKACLYLMSLRKQFESHFCFDVCFENIA